MPDSFDYTTGTNSENVRLLQALIDDAPEYTEETNSRNANILKSIINNTEYTNAPQSEIEELLLRLKAKIGGEIEVDELTVTENGTYDAGVNKAYNPVKVELPLSSKTITENGTYTASDDNLAGFNEVTVAVEGYAKKSISNTPTAIATFNASALPMPSLTVGIEAVQAGNGDPSPTNVRPISGWSAVNVYDTEKNLFDSNITITANYYNDNGEEITSSTTGHSALTKVNTSTLYKVFIYALNSANIGGKWGVYYWDSNKNFISRNVVDYAIDYTQNAIVFTTPNNCSYISFQLPIGTSATTGGFDKTKCYLFENDTTSDFVPYSGQTYTTTLKDGQGNPLVCYGGTLSNENGVQRLSNDTYYMTVDKDSTIASSRVPSDGNRICTYALPVVPNYEADMLICDKLKKDMSQSPYNYPEANSVRLSEGYLIVASNTSITSREEFVNWLDNMGGIHVRYKRATPQQISQDNLPIATQEDTNNLWADSGDVLSGEYLEAL